MTLNKEMGLSCNTINLGVIGIDFCMRHGWWTVTSLFRMATESAVLQEAVRFKDLLLTSRIPEQRKPGVKASSVISMAHSHLSLARL